MTIKERLNEQRTQPFIVFHDAYQYFLQAYGLESMQIGLVQEFH
jgi:ABC-type Zn2+ transport system substrate-binding protein/surface adhesin